MPAGGSAAAATVAMAAGLVEKAARLSSEQIIDWARIARRAARLRRLAWALIESDAEAYTAYVEALRAARGKNAEAREKMLRQPRGRIIDGPLKMARYAYEVAEIAYALAIDGNPRLRSDSSVALQLAASAARSAALTLADNVTDRKDPRLLEIRALATASSVLARRRPSPGRAGGRDRAAARSRGSGPR